MNIGSVVGTVVFESIEETDTTELEEAPLAEIPQEEPVSV